MQRFLRIGRAIVFLVSSLLSHGKGGRGDREIMTQQTVSLFETNHVCLITLSVRHMP